MTTIRKAHEQRFIVSAFTKETTYGILVAVAGAGYTELDDHEIVIPSGADDSYTTNKEEVNGSEIATTSEITEKRVSFSYSKPRTFPLDMALFGGLHFGSLASTKDGAFTGYQHYISPIAVGTNIPSMSGIVVDEGDTRQYLGLKSGAFKLTMEEGGHWQLESDLVGSGGRDDNADSLAGITRVSELTMKARDTKVYIKTSPNPASDIIAPANFDQDTDNISAAQNLVSIGDRVKSISIENTNEMNLIAGAGGAGVLQDAWYGRRQYNISIVLRYNDQTELDYYNNLTDLALEINCNSGTLIDAAGAFDYGFIYRVPLCRVRVYPTTDGGAGDPEQTINLEFEVMDDGTNKFADMAVYNAIAAFLA